MTKPTLIELFEKQSLRVTSLAVSASHVIVSTHDGAVWCWGRGTGQNEEKQRKQKPFLMLLTFLFASSSASYLDYQLGNRKRAASSVPLRVTELFEEEKFRAAGVACSPGCSFAFGETLL